jgi:hypothetical protein
MTIRYVGIGGNDASDGLSWANRKLTLNGVEDSPVAAGDTVYVGAGTYRELLTVDVSGAAGNPITYIGDYDGSHTDLVGGVVRITGSDNDLTAVRTNCIVFSAKTYRTFRGFITNSCTNTGSIGTIYSGGASSNLIFDKFFFGDSLVHGISFSECGVGVQITNSFFNRPYAANRLGVTFSSAAGLSNRGHLINNCIFAHGHTGVNSSKVGGITISNCLFIGGDYGITTTSALPAGQTITVNNSIFNSIYKAISASTLGEIVEDYNSFYGNATDRVNTNTGANSNAYPPLFDPRWFFEMVNHPRLITPFDLASFSQLVNVAGTSPTATDMRGTGTIGAQREWGALEYDPGLKIRNNLKNRMNPLGG